MAHREQQQEVVQWLGTPQAYAHRPETVEHIETHISHVYLAGPYVYKLKKSVRYDFLDFSTLAKRELACREELRLNRRLAAETYLGVVPVVRDRAGKLKIDGAEQSKDSGRVVDWLVQMRRLPMELTLDVLQRRGQLRREHIARLAETLVQFYRTLPPVALSPEEYRQGYGEHVGANLRELVQGKHHLSRSVVQRTHAFQLQLLRLFPELFDERVAAGRIVDGHGDLRPEHICLSEPIAIFDCIEFNAEFRRVDIADELAFLAEECDRLDARWVGLNLITSYQSASGDSPPPLLLDFYKAYRACVRAKVCALRAQQLVGPPRQAAEEEARQYLALADEYAEPWLAPLVLVVGGASGTGKSTLAAALAASLGAELLRTDCIRKEVFGREPPAAAMSSGIYQPEARERVYAEMMRRLEALHAQRVSVVLDGTFSTVSALRAVQAALAHSPKKLFLAIECVCRPQVARERIAARLAGGRDASEARPELHDLQRTQWEAWPADMPQIRVDTEPPLERQLAQVQKGVRTLFGPSGGERV